MAETMKCPSLLSDVTPSAPRLIDVVDLTGGADVSYTVPAGTRFVLLSHVGGGGFAFRVGAAAAMPSAAVTNGTGSMFVPSSYQCKVEEGTVLHFIRGSASTTYVTVGRYST